MKVHPIAKVSSCIAVMLMLSSCGWFDAELENAFWINGEHLTYGKEAVLEVTFRKPSFNDSAIKVFGSIWIPGSSGKM
jgi:hypothetical protein